MNSNVIHFPTTREQLYRAQQRHTGPSVWYVQYTKTYHGGMFDGTTVTDELPVYCEEMADFWIHAHEGQRYRYDSLTEISYTNITKVCRHG